MSEVLDILIIGGGPIGLTCGIRAQEAGLTFLIVEKGCLTNSLFNYPQQMTFFSSSEKLEIGDSPFVTTLPKPKRAEALEYYRRVAQKFKLPIQLFETVESVEKQAEIFHIQTSKGTYYARQVIVATGFYDIPSKLGIPGEELPKVTHYYQDPHYYCNQRVVVIGASNSSIDAALETYRKGAQVTLVIRGKEISPRVKYWVKPDIENRIAAGEIQVYYESNVTAITADTVTISSPQGDIELGNDFVLALTGYQPNFTFLRNIGIDIPEEQPCIPCHNSESMETNITGIYLAGVVCGGLNTHLWFIENSRVHAEQIIGHILDKQSKPVS